MRTKVYGKALRRPRHSIFESSATPSPPKPARVQANHMFENADSLEYEMKSLKLELEVAETPKESPKESPRRCPLKETHCNTSTSKTSELKANHEVGDVELETRLVDLNVQTTEIELPRRRARQYVHKDTDWIPPTGVIPSLESLSISPKPRQPPKQREAALKTSTQPRTTSSEKSTLELSLSTPTPVPSESSKPKTPRPHIVPRTRRRISVHKAAKSRPYQISLDAPTTAYLAPLIPLSPPIEDFWSWLASRLPHLTISKIGEGSYGEVYRASPRSPGSAITSADRSPHESQDLDTNSVIFKLIPLRPRIGPGSRNDFTSPQAAANELKLLARMSSIPGFVEFRGACLLKGRMPAALVEEWVRYKGEGMKSVESRDPRGRGGYGANQVWCLVEMSDAGCDLEGWAKDIGRGYAKDNAENGRSAAEKIWDVWWQVVGGLVRGEMGAGFEHRDLHWGNVCVREDGLRQKPIPVHAANGNEVENGLKDSADEGPFGMYASGCRASIIDYTLSRVELEDGAIISTRLDEDEDLMCSDNPIYRNMMDVHRKSWDSFEPVTNVMWVEHLLEKLLEAVPKAKKGDKKETGGGVGEEGGLRAKKMLQILRLVQKMLSSGMRKVKPLNSVGDVLDMAVRCGWVRVEDFLNG